MSLTINEKMFAFRFVNTVELFTLFTFGFGYPDEDFKKHRNNWVEFIRLLKPNAAEISSNYGVLKA